VHALATAAIIGETVASRCNEQLLAASNREAKKYIRGVLARLSAADFHDSKLLALNEGLQRKPVRKWFDIYGVEDDEGRWYVKFRIEEETGLLVVSCHGPVEDLKLKSGKVIRKWIRYSP
jgi:hypothetical protein